MFAEWRKKFNQTSEHIFVLSSILEQKQSGAALYQGFPVAQTVKNLPAMRETWVRSLGWEDLLEKGMATHSSILAWRIPMDRGAWWATVHVVVKSQINWATKHTAVRGVLTHLLSPGSPAAQGSTSRRWIVVDPGKGSRTVERISESNEISFMPGEHQKQTKEPFLIGWLEASGLALRYTAEPCADTASQSGTCCFLEPQSWRWLRT